MVIESAAFTEEGTIQAVIDGVTLFVPDDPGNRHRRLLAAWEAAGNAIAAYPPAPLAAADVTAARDARLAAGFADPVTGKTFQCDPVSQGKWTAVGTVAGLAIAMGDSPLPDFALIAADNSIVALTAGDALALVKDRIIPWVSATMLFARTLKDAIEAGNPPQDVAAGWP